MCEELLDLKTLFNVRAAAPKPTDTPPSEAKLILAKLDTCMTEENIRRGMDEVAFWQISIHEIRFGFPDALTAARIGRICRAMGLTTRRMNIGYLVLINETQLKILKAHFGL